MASQVNTIDEDMLNFKELAENILSDLMGGTSISDILLKTKIFASKRNDQELLDWVSNELSGYKNRPPDYRILTSGLRIKVFVPYRGESRIEFPIEIVKNEQIRERLSKMPFHDSIEVIESLCKDANSDGDGTISMHVPVGVYSYFSEFINGDIQDAYQYVPVSAVRQMLVSVKTLLIDFLLKVSNEEDINFNTFIKNNQDIARITINANAPTIINSGSGDVNTQGTTTIVGDNNTIVNADNKEELLRILSEIDNIALENSNNTDYKEISEDIKAELKKDVPEKKFLKRCFQAIPGFFSNVGAGIIANKLTPLVSSAINLL